MSKQEKKDAMEAFSHLLLKADEWSAKIDELHKSMICEEGRRPIETLKWITNIEGTVSEHECSLQVLEKRSTEVCSQLEKVAIMLDNARNDMERLQKQEEERISRTHDQLQAFQDIIQREHGETSEVQTASKENSEQVHDPCLQEEQIWLSRFLEEKKNLEAERETVLCLKEQISEADATLRKQLHEHALRMQTETEEITRQKKELEYAKNIAAEIALEVENSRRELEMYKTTFNKTITEAQGKVPHTEVSLTAHLATKSFLNYERHLEQSRRWKLHRRPYSSADVHRNSSHGLDFLDNLKSPQSEALMVQEVEEDMYYIRAQEEFLMQAEKALEGMSFNEVCCPLARV